MLFNSIQYIFMFLPFTIIIYFFLNFFQKHTIAKVWLVIASLYFYSYWNIKYLPLILISIIFNFFIGHKIRAIKNSQKKILLIFGLFGNLFLLAYYKYMDFFIANVNYALGTKLELLNIILPLGISFFTFTQIAYLVDIYKGKVKETKIVNYFLFVTYFPHLLAGPIIHHDEMMPQFEDNDLNSVNYKNLSMGIFLFFIGLFKKVIIADSFVSWVNMGFDQSTILTFSEAWVVTLAYTLQIYFDFSGYTDMALGASLMLNIKLPINFNSPYKALNLQDFWRRWHITLSRFLRDYVYIPLGGSRVSQAAMYVNLIITFLLGGLWHGAGWTFIFWGFLHGIGLVVHRQWQKLKITMPKLFAWSITFIYINIAWVFFRAKDWEDAVKILKGLFGLNGVRFPAIFKDLLFLSNNIGANFGYVFTNIYISDESLPYFLIILMISFIINIVFRNSNELLERFQPTYKNAFFIIVLMTCALFNIDKVVEFLYFNF